MALCGMFSALLCICAWLSVPFGDGAITLQTFGVFLCLGVLGGKWGTIAIAVYLCLGVTGVPVFSGFRGGLGALLGTTGGYLTGFLLCGLTYWLLTFLFPKKQLLAMIAGLLVCYCFGSLWYYFLYTSNTATLSIIFIKCVLPYLLPDALKLILARFLSKRISQKISP